MLFKLERRGYILLKFAFWVWTHDYLFPSIQWAILWHILTSNLDKQSWGRILEPFLLRLEKQTEKIRSFLTSGQEIYVHIMIHMSGYDGSTQAVTNVANCEFALNNRQVKTEVNWHTEWPWPRHKLMVAIKVECNYKNPLDWRWVARPSPQDQFSEWHASFGKTVPTTGNTAAPGLVSRLRSLLMRDN